MMDLYPKPSCIICHKPLDLLDSFVYVSDVGHLCKECSNKIRSQLMVITDNNISDNVLSQEDIDALRKHLNLHDENNQEAIGSDCLTEAFKIINGHRQNDYGKPENSFERIADYWSNFLTHAHIIKDGTCISAKDVAIMMVLFKIARLENGYTHDSCVDICGYTAILDQLHKEN